LDPIGPRDALRLLEIDAATVFARDSAGRMTHENDPDRSSPPRFYFAGCEGGNLLRLSRDVGDGIAREIATLAAQEPSFSGPRSVPRFLDRYRELLAIDAPAMESSYGLIHLLPHRVPCATDATLVAQGSAQGDALLARLRRHGLSEAMIGMGFADLSHLWEPWCVALVGDAIAALAFAARLGEHGAALGLATMPAYRGRGLAAAVTAGWSALPQLQTRTLIYSTTRDNHASRRVIARLRLPYVGTSLRLV